MSWFIAFAVCLFAINGLLFWIADIIHRRVLFARIKELEAANARDRQPGLLWKRICRLHRWLRQARERHQFVLYGLDQQAVTLDAYQARAAMADELAIRVRVARQLYASALRLGSVDGLWWDAVNDFCTDTATLLTRYDAAQEDHDGR